MTAEADRSERDQTLLSAARNGDRAAMDDFIRRNDRWLRGVIYSVLGPSSAIDDVLQQVWTRVCRQLGTLAEIERWRGWLFRLTRNTALDASLANRRRQKLSRPLAEGFDPPDGQMRPDEQLASAESQQKLLGAIRALPVIYREPFILRHLEDWSYAQVAEALSLPLDTVQTRLVRARRLLREALTGNPKASREEADA